MRAMTVWRSHTWVDQRSLALARAIAAKLGSDPAGFEVARRNLQNWKGHLEPWPDDLAEWEGILDSGDATALAQLTEESPRGCRLRQSNPFAGVLTPRERKAIFDYYESIPA